jgi:predicted PurR-regulated permease PerM
VLAVERRAAARDIWRAVEHETGAYLRSEIIQCAAAGLLLNIGFRMLGHPYPALMALIAALAWLIPWIGAVIAVVAVIATSMLWATLHGGPGLLALALPASVWTIAVLFFLEFVVEPYLFNRKRYNALLVVLVVVGLTDWLGLIGLLIGPPLAAALQILGSYVLSQRQQAAIDQTEPNDSLHHRLRKLRTNLAAMGESRPEVKSLMDRLSSLIDEAKTMPQALRSRLKAPAQPKRLPA